MIVSIPVIDVYILIFIIIIAIYGFMKFVDNIEEIEKALSKENVKRKIVFWLIGISVLLMILQFIVVHLKWEITL